MKKINLILFLFLSCILLSCEPKKEKKEPAIIQNNQNFRYDDEPVRVKACDSIKKSDFTKKSKKVV